jgi:hypothetical protein
MAIVVNKSTLELARADGSPEYTTASWVRLTTPEAEAVKAIPRRFRKWTGTDVAEMSESEKDAVLAATVSASDDAHMLRFSLRDADGLQFLMLHNLNNRVRVLEGELPLTPQAFKSAMRDLLETL